MFIFERAEQRESHVTSNSEQLNQGRYNSWGNSTLIQCNHPQPIISTQPCKLSPDSDFYELKM